MAFTPGSSIENANQAAQELADRALDLVQRANRAVNAMSLHRWLDEAETEDPDFMMLSDEERQKIRDRAAVFAEQRGRLRGIWAP
jgi:hypothetical protein